MQQFYTVRPGEYPYLIATRWKLPLHTLIASNNIQYPYVLYPGNQLSIPPGIMKYKIKKGDTLFKISEFFGIPLSFIAEANNISPPYSIKENDILIIPPGLPYYQVKEGDSLYSIAQRYNVMKNGIPYYELIIKVNNLSGDIISPGMKLQIPYSYPTDKGIIAYTSDKSGNFELWIYNLKNREDYPLTESLGAIHSTPFFSPNGKKIAFVGKNNILYVIDVYSKFISKIDKVVPYTYIGWSPDSRFISYGREKDIIVYNLETHKHRKIKETKAKDVQFYKNGLYLIYHAYDSSNISQVFTIGIDGKRKKQLTKNTYGQINFLRLSHDEKYILYTLPGASISIINVMEIATRKIIEAPGGDLGKNYMPMFSPDSSKILYSSTAYDVTGYYSELKVFIPSSLNDFIWAVSNCYVTPLSWSPDGGRFIYVTDCENKASNKIWMINLTHPAPTMLTQGGTIPSLAWSPQ